MDGHSGFDKVGGFGVWVAILHAVCIFKCGVVYSTLSHTNTHTGQWCGPGAPCGILAKDVRIAARKVSKVAQKVWVHALVWSTGCSGWVETKRKVGSGSDSVRGETEVGSKVLQLTQAKKSKLCVCVCVPVGQHSWTVSELQAAH